MKPFLFFYLTRKGLWLFFLLSAIFLAACRPPEQEQSDEAELPFETIKQDDWGSHANENSYPGDQMPRIFVITGPEEIQRVTEWISGEMLLSLERVDYENNFVIVVFQGWQSTSGYGVQIERVTYQRNVVNVYAQFHEPPSGVEVAMQITFPYHIIQVTKPAEWRSGEEFYLIVNGEVVATDPPPPPTPTPVVSPYPMPPTPGLVGSPYP